MPHRFGSISLVLSVALLSAVPAMGQMDSGAYVSGHYVGLLNRWPDPGGWIYQKTALDTGLPRETFTNGIIGSPEFSLRRSSAWPYQYCYASSYTFVECLYQAGLQRQGSPAEISGWTTYPNSVSARGIIGSGEFAMKNGAALSYRTDYVTPTKASPTGNITAGSQTLLTVEYSNQYGVNDVSNGQIIINAGVGPVNGAGACYIGWDVWGNLHLSYADNPGGTADVPGPTMTAPQCSIVPGLSSIQTSSGFKLTLAITFPAAFDGTHNIYSFATNREGLSTPWTYLGQLAVTTSSANFALTAPSPQTVLSGVPANAKFAINISGTAAGPISFSASGLPAGATATFNPQGLSGPGTTLMTVTTTAATPVGVFPIGVVATSGSIARTTTATLNVAASAAAVLLTPAAGTILTGGPATFSWSAGTGVSQYQLLVGSSSGGAEYYTSAVTAATNVTAILPTTLTRALYVTVRSMIGGSWVNRTSTYSVEVPTVIPGSLKVGTRNATTGGSSNYVIINDGQPTRVGPIYAQQEIGGQIYADNARTILSCGLSNSSGIRGNVVVPSDYDPFDGSSFDLVVSADSTTTPGLRRLTCQYVNGQIAQDSGDRIGVYDGGPVIESIEQHPPSSPGGPFYISLYGRNFGRVRGSIDVCNRGADPCAGSIEVSVNSYGPFAYWSDNQINVELVPVSTQGGVYDVQVTSLGANGFSFTPAPQGGTSSRSNRAQVQVTPGTAAVQIMRADVAADQITVNVSAVAGVSGELNVYVDGPSRVNLFQQIVESGNYNVSFNRPNLPLGSYGSVGASWSTGNGTATTQRPTAFKNLGLTRFSTYNVPTESSCTYSEVPAFVFDVYNSRGCKFYLTFLSAEFMQQVYTNGTGISNYNGVLKSWDAGSKHLCSLGTVMTSRNTFFATTSPTGQCNTPLDDSSVAVAPGPRDNNSSWACSDRVVVVNSSNATVGVKKVADRCPDCADPKSFPGTQGHIDAFSTSRACSPKAFSDFGNYNAIQVK